MNRHGPLSPHLRIYRLPLPAYLSIGHRITGVALTLSLPILALWLAVSAWFPEKLSAIAQFWRSPLGKIFLFLWTVALVYHFVHGIRHLLWDLFEVGFERKRLLRYAQWEIFAVLVLVVLMWSV